MHFLSFSHSVNPSQSDFFTISATFAKKVLPVGYGWQPSCDHWKCKYQSNANQLDYHERDNAFINSHRFNAFRRNPFHVEKCEPNWWRDEGCLKTYRKQDIIQKIPFYPFARKAKKD